MAVDPIAEQESWKFLPRITDIVRNFFSPEAQKATMDCGITMRDVGMIYIHVVADLHHKTQTVAQSQQMQSEKKSQQALPGG